MYIAPYQYLVTLIGSERTLGPWIMLSDESEDVVTYQHGNAILNCNDLEYCVAATPSGYVQG